MSTQPDMFLNKKGDENERRIRNMRKCYYKTRILRYDDERVTTMFIGTVPERMREKVGLMYGLWGIQLLDSIL
jgi:hypothetical protein